MRPLLFPTALVLLAAMVTAFAYHAPKPQTFAGTTTWVQTVGRDLYDTQSGDLDLGFYVAEPSGTFMVHQSTTTITSATTSDVILPDGIYRSKTKPAGTQAHIIGTKYIDYFSDGTKQVGDPAVDSAVGAKDAPTPTKGAAGTTPI